MNQVATTMPAVYFTYRRDGAESVHKHIVRKIAPDLSTRDMWADNGPTQFLVSPAYNYADLAKAACGKKDFGLHRRHFQPASAVKGNILWLAIAFFAGWAFLSAANYAACNSPLMKKWEACVE